MSSSGLANPVCDTGRPLGGTFSQSAASHTSGAAVARRARMASQRLALGTSSAEARAWPVAGSVLRPARWVSVRCGCVVMEIEVES